MQYYSILSHYHIECTVLHIQGKKSRKINENHVPNSLGEVVCFFSEGAKLLPNENQEGSKVV
jgi:hypothetical protein